MWIIILINLLLFCAYYYIIKPLKYWEEKKVQHEKPLPIFGNWLPVVLKKTSTVELFQKIYKRYPNGRYIGVYNFVKPSLILTDPDLIKKIMVKEFETFPDHRDIIPNEIDPLWSKNLFAIKGGEEWHQIRSTLSPSFTSSKMKSMFMLMKECAKEFSNFYKSKEGTTEINAKDVLARFANDVIATCAFGVTCDSQADPKNEFYLLAKKVTNFSGTIRVAIIISFFSTFLAKVINVPIFSKEVREFFTTLVKDTLRIREEKNIVRPDMLHLLMEARKGRLKFEEDSHSVPEAGFAVAEESEFGKVHKKANLEFTDEIITAQALIFFFAGFETVSTLMSYACYELAINPDIQKKLRDEIEESIKLTNGELTYEKLMSMKYLDMVVSETLRKWPPAPIINRKSIRPYVIEAQEPNESDVYLEKNSVIVCTIFAMHHDERYYPNPEKFDPERFNEENRSRIHPCTYIPFGVGPRNCIGSRFALLEGKLLIAETVKNFDIVPTSKTQIPIVLSKTSLLPLPDDGIWIGLKQRGLE